MKEKVQAVKNKAKIKIREYKDKAVDINDSYNPFQRVSNELKKAGKK